MMQSRSKLFWSTVLMLYLFFLFVTIADSHQTKSKGRVPGKKMAVADRCLKTSNDVGCDVFQCLANIDACELDGLHILCRKLSRVAGEFTKSDLNQTCGKIFIKRSLMCITRAVKSNFSRRSRKCEDMEAFINRIQTECYTVNNLCRTANSNVESIMEIISPKDILSKRASLRLFQLVLNCGKDTVEKYKELITMAIGQSFLSTLHYFEDDTTSFMEALNILTTV